MECINRPGLLGLDIRMCKLSEQLCGLTDEVYRRRAISIQARWLPLLRHLHERGPQTISEIEDALGHTHAHIEHLVDNLSRDGWLKASASSGDTHAYRIGLSEKARRALRDAGAATKAIEEALGLRCTEAGIDPMAMLDQLASVFGQVSADEIVDRGVDVQCEAVRVVTFRPELREHFYRLNADWLRKYFCIESIDHRVLSNPEAEILAPGGQIFFALLGDAVVGTCALKHEGEDACELTKMAVEERYQGRGIGRALIGAAIDEFRRWSACTLFLETSTKLAPAIRLYESVGFQHQPHLKPDSHYDRADVYMVWRDPTFAADLPSSTQRLP